MEHRTVATWSYKTTLLFQLVRAKTARAIPRERFRELYLRERPPSDVRIWLASAKANNAMHETSTEINLANTRHQVPGFFAAIALGHLLVLCAGRLFSGEEQLRIGSGVNLDTTVEIWPASVRPAPWPPPIPLEDLQAKTLVQML
jgi:hypothetical protein